MEQLDLYFEVPPIHSKHLTPTSCFTLGQLSREELEHLILVRAKQQGNWGGIRNINVSRFLLVNPSSAKSRLQACEYALAV
jgi:hypothetical protein